LDWILDTVCSAGHSHCLAGLRPVPQWYSLGGAVWTRDLAGGERIAADQIQSGAAFVNDMSKSDPRMPFGGIRNSGYGRELSIFGIREFVNVHAVWVNAP
jgi:succinate-semialdehyde dehydrogenase/glutarate-semialdehyde dehydrogenase